MEKKAIRFYFWPTPNGQKIAIMLEELGWPYDVILVDITRGDQMKPEYVALNPNNKMPTIVDPDGPGDREIVVFESGAILIYLAEKADRFIPKGTRERYAVLQWLMFQMAGFGPLLGQAHHFRRFAKVKIEYAIERYTTEANRLYRVLDKQLDGRDFVAGEYSIADMALYPWSRSADWQGVEVDDYPNVRAWQERMLARPAVQRALELKATN